MEIVLLDWTRMGNRYCIAGAYFHASGLFIVRPLSSVVRDHPQIPCGWSPLLFDGHERWQIFEADAPSPREPAPPHTEDIWVRTLRPTARFATAEQRRLILEQTTPNDGEPPFGAALSAGGNAAYLPQGQGVRSLCSLRVPSRDLFFQVNHFLGRVEPDYRVTMTLPGLPPRSIPVKDHHLLCRAEQNSSSPVAQERFLNDAVRRMGETVLVRLGLGRPFLSGCVPEPVCWLMADGFFSADDPRN